MKIKLTLLAACALALCGCTSTAKIIKALEKDRASFKLRVTTIYGNIDIQRINPAAGHSASLSPDGLMKVEWVAPTNVAPSLVLPQPQPVSVVRTPEVDRAIDAFFGTRPPPPKANSAP